MRLVLLLLVTAACTVDLPGDSDGVPTSSPDGATSSDPTSPSLTLCPDCRIFVPPSYSRQQPMPLLIALHGDEGRDIGRGAATQGVIDLWSATAAQMNVIVYAPPCAAEIGCDGAWSDHLAAQGYHLSAATLAWLDAQVDAIEDAYNIDVRRELLTGYSGGAYWLGYAAQARADRYASVAFVAGGMPAYTAFNPCPARKLPGYFLGGDQDYRTKQMSDTANAFASCGEEIQTDLVTGADHETTIASLGTGRAATILKWMLARPR